MGIEQRTRRAKRLAREKELAAPVPTLPIEIIFEILIMLSVENLLRLKTVCKEWFELIQDPNFIEKHLRRGKRNPIDHKERVQRLAYFSLLSDLFVNLSTTRGLLLQRSIVSSKYVIRNPVTRQILDLPDPHKTSLSMTLAYVKTTKEYKVINVYADPDEASREGCEVLTIGNRADWAWKQLKVPDFMTADSKGHQLMTMPRPKAIHYIRQVTAASFAYIQLNSLDLATDTLSSVVVPAWLFSNSLKVLAFTGNGCLALGAIDEQKKTLTVLFLKDQKEPTWENSAVVYDLDGLDVGGAVPFFIEKEWLLFCVKAKNAVIGYNTISKRVRYTGKSMSDIICKKCSSLVFLRGMLPDTNMESYDLNKT